MYSRNEAVNALSSLRGRNQLCRPRFSVPAGYRKSVSRDERVCQGVSLLSAFFHRKGPCSFHCKERRCNSSGSIREPWCECGRKTAASLHSVIGGLNACIDFAVPPETEKARFHSAMAEDMMYGGCQHCGEQKNFGGSAIFSAQAWNYTPSRKKCPF